MKNQGDLNDTLNCTFSFPKVQSLLLGVNSFLLKRFWLASGSERRTYDTNIGCQWNSTKKRAKCFPWRQGSLNAMRFWWNLFCVMENNSLFPFKKADCKLKQAQGRAMRTFRLSEREYNSLATFASSSVSGLILKKILNCFSKNSFCSLSPIVHHSDADHVCIWNGFLHHSSNSPRLCEYFFPHVFF